MRFLANENFPLIVVRQLAKDGFDIISATVVCQGANDMQILSQAVKEGRIVMTFDKDYGELIFRQKKAIPPGIVLLRISPKSPDYIYDRLVRILKSDLPLDGHFTIISEKKVRFVPIRR